MFRSFCYREKSVVPNSPNYVSSTEANNPETIKESSTAMVHFKCVSHCAKLQEEQRKQLERDMLALREATKQKETMLCQCLNVFNNDHTYATQPFTKSDLLSLQCQSNLILFQPAADESTMRSVEVQLENKNIEEVNYNSGIPAEIGKTAVFNF